MVFDPDGRRRPFLDTRWGLLQRKKWMSWASSTFCVLFLHLYSISVLDLSGFGEIFSMFLVLLPTDGAGRGRPTGSTLQLCGGTGCSDSLEHELLVF